MIVELEEPAPTPKRTPWDDQDLSAAEMVQSDDLLPAVRRLLAIVEREALTEAHRDAFEARMAAVRRAADRMFAVMD